MHVCIGEGIVEFQSFRIFKSLELKMEFCSRAIDEKRKSSKKQSLGHCVTHTKYKMTLYNVINE